MTDDRFRFLRRVCVGLLLAATLFFLCGQLGVAGAQWLTAAQWLNRAKWTAGFLAAASGVDAAAAAFTSASEAKARKE